MRRGRRHISFCFHASGLRRVFPCARPTAALAASLARALCRSRQVEHRRRRRGRAPAYFRGQSQSEIAHALDAPIGTIKSRISRGLEWLRATADARHVPHAPQHGGLY
ncbi:sigma factor-like helix-turn-helix DNA-binding protein [Paraburkholderia xenovorans]|uniref:sigma factor-like helix-turn-helix DNA-binding protein n=1 Tax=Paraburkholderia xenovorans TaxID=36873 RepID=UPI0038B96223